MINPTGPRPTLDNIQSYLNGKTPLSLSPISLSSPISSPSSHNDRHIEADKIDLIKARAELLRHYDREEAEFDDDFKMKSDEHYIEKAIDELTKDGEKVSSIHTGDVTLDD
jgi:hypothetical protein